MHFLILFKRNRSIEIRNGDTPKAAANISFCIPVSCLYKEKAELNIAQISFPNPTITSHILLAPKYRSPH